MNFSIQVGAAWDKNLLGQCTDFIIIYEAIFYSLHSLLSELST